MNNKNIKNDIYNDYESLLTYSLEYKTIENVGEKMTLLNDMLSMANVLKSKIFKFYNKNTNLYFPNENPNSFSDDINKLLNFSYSFFMKSYFSDETIECINTTIKLMTNELSKLKI
jgi:hypothetical protein